MKIATTYNLIDPVAHVVVLGQDDAADEGLLSFSLEVPGPSLDDIVQDVVRSFHSVKKSKSRSLDAVKA